MWLTKSEPRDAARTSFIENLGGARMHGGCTGTDPVARWKSNGHPGGCHLQYVMWRVEQHSTSNQVHTGLTTIAVGTHEPRHIFLKRIVAGLLESAN